jgi:hypothetical protein
MMIPRLKRRVSRAIVPPVATHWARRIVDNVGGILTVARSPSLIASLLIAMTAELAFLNHIQFGPPVGAILTFGPYLHPVPIWHLTVLRDSDQRRCLLQPAVMATAPGSLIVEARSADGRSFRAHWAGGPTSDRAHDCGNGADLTISLPAMQTLMNADGLSHQHWERIGS